MTDWKEARRAISFHLFIRWKALLFLQEKQRKIAAIQQFGLRLDNSFLIFSESLFLPFAFPVPFMPLGLSALSKAL